MTRELARWGWSAVVFACVVSLERGALAATGGASGEAPIQSIEELVALIPKEAARDLEKTSKQEAAARDITTKLQAAARRRLAAFTLTLEFWQPWSGGGPARYRLKPAIEECREKGARFRVEMWVYALPELGSTVEKLKRGDKFKVTGTLRRVDMTIHKGPMLHLDLDAGAISLE